MCPNPSLQPTFAASPAWNDVAGVREGPNSTPGCESWDVADGWVIRGQASHGRSRLMPSYRTTIPLRTMGMSAVIDLAGLGGLRN